ncbi:hypothetical protein GCM10010103_16770 [Streptomyces paradoxus]
MRRERASRGRTGTVLTQTMKFRASGGAALRVRTFEAPQHAAAPTTRAKAPSGPEVPSSTAATAMPARAISMPSRRMRDGRSPRVRAAIAAVNTAWICRTREDRPAGMPASMPTKSRPNFATPRTRPTATIHFHATFGRPTRNTAGSAAARKRRAEKSRGGKWSRPISMTVKLTPQTAATRTARARCDGRMR